MQQSSLPKGGSEGDNGTDGLGGVDGANDADAGEPMDVDEQEGDETVDAVTKTVDALQPLDPTRPDTDKVDGLLPNASQALGSFLM